VVAGFALAVMIYGFNVPVPVLAPVKTALEQRLYIDIFYERVFVNGMLNLSTLVAWFDRNIVDGLVNLVSALFWVSAESLKYIENGKTQFYLLMLVSSVLTMSVVGYALQAPQGVAGAVQNILVSFTGL
jgi:hypothetical protein